MHNDINKVVSFLIQRDGKDATVKFAEQTLSLYVSAAINESKYKESIDEYIRFLEKEEKQVNIIVIK